MLRVAIFASHPQDAEDDANGSASGAVLHNTRAHAPPCFHLVLQTLPVLLPAALWFLSKRDRSALLSPWPCALAREPTCVPPPGPLDARTCYCGAGDAPIPWAPHGCVLLLSDGVSLMSLMSLMLTWGAVGAQAWLCGGIPSPLPRSLGLGCTTLAHR